MTHRFHYNWRMPDDYDEANGYSVFSTFACGGGSTMGYKLAGYDVLGCVEIDQEMFRLYRHNHEPEYAFCEDIREFVKRHDLPNALYDLDVLDGSPPCSTFSNSGNREEGWGKEKRFREGQTSQRLDDLFGVYIKLADKLQPRVVVSENVTGMIHGASKGYVKEIVRDFDKAGYDTQIFKLNAASMGVPQKRERIFPIARRRDLNLPDLALSFDEPPITFGEIREDRAVGYKEMTQFDERIWAERRPSERHYGEITARIRDNDHGSSFNAKFIDDHRVCNTIVSASGGKLICGAEKRFLSNRELRKASTFPVNYNFGDAKPKYVMGMSVPPVMMAQITTEVQNQWLDRL